MRRSRAHRPGARLRFPLRRRSERRCRAEGRRRERVPDRPHECRHAVADHAARRGCSRTAGRSPASSRRTSAAPRASSSRSTARSSMKGKPFGDAVAAAQAFLLAKPGRTASRWPPSPPSRSLLTGFSTSAADAPDRAPLGLGSTPWRARRCTTASSSPRGRSASRPHAGRVLIAVTDGNETRSAASLAERDRRRARGGRSVYVVAIESALFNPAPLEVDRPARRAAPTAEPARAGSSARSTPASRGSSSARGGSSTRLPRAPGDELRLQALTGCGEGERGLSIPGPTRASSNDTLLPERVYRPARP